MKYRVEAVIPLSGAYAERTVKVDSTRLKDIREAVEFWVKEWVTVLTPQDEGADVRVIVRITDNDDVVWEGAMQVQVEPSTGTGT